MIISRADLYLLVWAYPVAHVADKLGISGVALGKWCRKLVVPTPGPGHWGRIRAGRKVDIPALPPLAEDLERTLSVSDMVEPELLALLAGAAVSSALAAPMGDATAKPSSSSSESLHPSPTGDSSARADRGTLRAPSTRKRRKDGTVPTRAAPVPVTGPLETAGTAGMLSELSKLADDFAQCREIEHFLALLDIEAARSDLALGTALIAFVSRARRELSQVDPIERVLKKCRPSS